MKEVAVNDQVDNDIDEVVPFTNAIDESSKTAAENKLVEQEKKYLKKSERTTSPEKDKPSLKENNVTISASGKATLAENMPSRTLISQSNKSSLGTLKMSLPKTASYAIDYVKDNVRDEGEVSLITPTLLMLKSWLRLSFKVCCQTV